MPCAFAFGDVVVGRPQYTVFAAFGSFALIGLMEFGGTMGNRVRSQLVLVTCGACMVVVGTLVSRDPWLGAAVMAVGTFTILFAGVVSSQIARASNSIVLPLVLATALPGSVGDLPARLAGFGSAGFVSLIAITLLWPLPAVDPLRGPTTAASRALARRLRRAPQAPGETESPTDTTAAALGRAFLSTPFRPTGLSTQTRLTVRLFEELEWVDRAVVRWQTMPTEPFISAAAADVLEACADALDHDLDGNRLANAIDELRARRDRSEQEALGAARAGERDAVAAEAFVTRLEPSFRAQELAFAVVGIGDTVTATVSAERRSWWSSLLGRQVAASEPLVTARRRALGHLNRNSVWFRNSLRGAAGLGLATLVAAEVGVQHSFWVVLGALTVLRSNALSTGQFVTRAVAGTLAGFAVGATLISLIGMSTGILWGILPVSILIGGLAPAVVSFATGQAAFTVTILSLFTIIAPEGWGLGVVRVEDVLLGCAISLVVSLIFWPRGAAAQLTTAIGEAYAYAGQYLAEAVDYASACCGFSGAPPVPPAQHAGLAIAAARRLDDSFRTYLAERGAKPAPLDEIANLVIGSAVLRLTADAVLALWDSSVPPVPADRTQARAELVAKAGHVRSWYDELAHHLTTCAQVDEPFVVDAASRSGFLTALDADLTSGDGRAATAVRLVWTDLHVNAAINLQHTIAESAQVVALATRPALSSMPAWGVPRA